MKDDEQLMAHALVEARRALGRTHPNPAVGAVVVKAGRVIARGYTAPAGGPHAEVVALKHAGRAAKGATLYTTLEPCGHFGRTPPCSDAIIAAGIARVVYASNDPNPLVNGKGVRRLKKAGVKVTAHVSRAEADALNQPFFKFMRTGMPWVMLKVAVTVDGKLATSSGDSKWVSSETSRVAVHVLRDQVDAVLVGGNTVKRDDPQLTARIEGARNPVRVVLDASNVVKPKASIFDGRARTIVVSPKHPKPLANVHFWPVTPLKAVLQRLAQQEGLLHVMVEGGAHVLNQFLSEGLFDELVVFVAPKLIGHEGITFTGNLGIRKMAKAQQLRLAGVEQLEDDVLLRYLPVS